LVNSGTGTYSNVAIDVDGLNGGLTGSDVEWGDADGDGDLDILARGTDTGAQNQLRVYLNNNGTIDFNQIEVNGLNGGLWDFEGEATWGDFDLDGDLDILETGIHSSGIMHIVRVFRNMGSGQFDPTEININISTSSFATVTASWADVDGDGDLDILATGPDSSGPRRTRVYINRIDRTRTATSPAPATTLTGSFDFSMTFVSTATFKWLPAADSGVGATSENLLNYDIQVATNSDFRAPFVVPGLATGTAMFSNYLRMPRIFDGNTSHGIMLKSTEAWTAPATALYGLRTDTTYYFRVFTVDAGLAVSTASATGALWTGVAPSAVTGFAAAQGGVPGTIDLAWTAPGDDQTKGTLNNSTFTIQYTTSDVFTDWDPLSPTAWAPVVHIATSSVTPGTTRYAALSGLENGSMYYVRVWTKDDAGQYSALSVGATAQTVVVIVDTGARYWVATVDSNWNNTGNWAYESGGDSGASVPASSHTVVFDDGSGTAASIDVAVDVATLSLTALYTGTITANGFDVTIASAYAQAGGRVELGTSAVTMNGADWRFTGAAFDAGMSTVTFAPDTAGTLAGSATFYGLRAVTSGATLYFEAGTTFYATTMVEFRDLTLRAARIGP